jgi:hypothetical protein
MWHPEGGAARHLALPRPTAPTEGSPRLAVEPAGDAPRPDPERRGAAAVSPHPGSRSSPTLSHKPRGRGCIHHTSGGALRRDGAAPACRSAREFSPLREERAGRGRGRGRGRGPRPVGACRSTREFSPFSRAAGERGRGRGGFRGMRRYHPKRIALGERGFRGLRRYHPKRIALGERGFRGLRRYHPKRIALGERGLSSHAPAPPEAHRFWRERGPRRHAPAPSEAPPSRSAFPARRLNLAHSRENV